MDKKKEKNRDAFLPSDLFCLLLAVLAIIGILLFCVMKARGEEDYFSSQCLADARYMAGEDREIKRAINNIERSIEERKIIIVKKEEEYFLGKYIISIPPVILMGGNLSRETRGLLTIQLGFYALENPQFEIEHYTSRVKAFEMSFRALENKFGPKYTQMVWKVKKALEDGEEISSFFLKNSPVKIWKLKNEEEEIFQEALLFVNAKFIILEEECPYNIRVKINFLANLAEGEE